MLKDWFFRAGSGHLLKLRSMEGHNVKADIGLISISGSTCSLLGGGFGALLPIRFFKVGYGRPKKQRSKQGIRYLKGWPT